MELCRRSKDRLGILGILLNECEHNECEHNERRKARLKKKSGARLKMRSVFDTQATLDGI